jgi:peptide/nickel transport system ATP-binding protein
MPIVRSRTEAARQAGAERSDTSDLLRVDGLAVSFQTRAGSLEVVRNVDLRLARGETLCVVGESGSGKTTMSLALVGLLPANARIAGHVELHGDVLSSYSEDQLSNVRGRRVGIIFQDPSRALNPVLTVGRQIGEVLQRHMGLTRRAAHGRTLELMNEVGINDVPLRVDQYPHELSGGLKQRVMIAMAIACEPELIIADEPTTALDVTIQRQVLRLLKGLSEERGLSLILVTHDFGVVAAMADNVAVMYAGRIIEYGTVFDTFRKPLHPYTAALLSANPRRVLDAREAGREAELSPIPGAPPSLIDRISGCEFSPRCRYRQAACTVTPPLGGNGHLAACWFPGIAR